MTVLASPPRIGVGHDEHEPEPTGLLKWLTSTDHKVIGKSYIATAFFFFCVAGLLALAMRAQLAQPENNLVSAEQYNQLFTMHGTMMMFLFATPLGFGLANYLVPLNDMGALALTVARMSPRVTETVAPGLPPGLA